MISAAMKKKPTRSKVYVGEFTTEQLCVIWKKICSDEEACEALKALEEANFPISHLKPNDASFRQPNWADYIAAIPLVSNKPSSSRIRASNLRKHMPIVKELREFVEFSESPFAEVTVAPRKDCPAIAYEVTMKDLSKAASVLEQFLHWNHSVRCVNSRNALIAELRWTIRNKTGKPHDHELSILIDAADRAAGRESSSYLEPNTLDRIETREKEIRVKTFRRIRQSASDVSVVRRSTRNVRNSQKRV